MVDSPAADARFVEHPDWFSAYAGAIEQQGLVFSDMQKRLSNNGSGTVRADFLLAIGCDDPPEEVLGASVATEGKLRWRRLE